MGDGLLAGDRSPDSAVDGRVGQGAGRLSVCAKLAGAMQSKLAGASGGWVCKNLQAQCNPLSSCNHKTYVKSFVARCRPEGGGSAIRGHEVRVPKLLWKCARAARGIQGN